MAIKSVSEWVSCPLEGRTYTRQFRKVPGFATTAQWWCDLSMAAGNPPANYYASTPGVAEILSRWDGLCTMDDKSPSETYLAKAMITATSANMVGQYKLCDYLLYYPFIDPDSLDEQTLTNSKSLERYTDGDGVQVMCVSQAPSTGSGSFTFKYYNQAGVEKTSPVNYCGTTSAPLGSIITSMPAVANMLGPFLKLADGDTGVRSITSVTMAVANGGLFAFVLVKPLIDFYIREASTTCEFEMISMRSGAIRIYDGAFLGFIAQTAASVSALPLVGQLEYYWK
jgi:hypothetical protein